jgi:hypothetical protein
VPVIAALEEYHETEGVYPERLEHLITAGYLSQMPELPTFGDSLRGGALYEYCEPLDLYSLSFAYDIPDGLFGEIVKFTFLSDERKWAANYGTLWDKACDRAAWRWREQGDAKSLATFMEVALEVNEWDRDYFYEERLKEWLGVGEAGEIPQPLPRGGGDCIIYRVAGEDTGYAFSFRPHFLPVRYGKSRDYPLVDRIYRIEGREGHESWTVFLDGESNRSTPP